MTQTIPAIAPASAAPGTVPAPVVTPAGPAAQGRQGRVRRALGRTPGKLGVARAVAVLACLVVGLGGLLSALAQASALSGAADDTAQMVGVQAVRNELVIADATATNAFLVGGLEPEGQRRQYDEAVAHASSELAELSGSNAEDARLLGDVVAALTVYTGLVEQARANNRQGFPVGAAYLDQASQVLRTDILPTLDAVVAANTDRVDGSFAAVDGAVYLLATAVLAFVVLVVVQGWLARRTHRRLNAGLAGASLVLAVAIVLGLWAASRAGDAAEDVRTGSYAETLSVSQAYALATDAKSQESFTLIKRGSGQAYEEAFQANVTEARSLLGDQRVDPELTVRLDDWVAAHDEIRALDDGGDWDAAVALAVSEDAGSPNARFDAFADAAEASIDASAAATGDALSDADTLVLLAGFAVLVAGLAGAALSWRGINARLREYR